MVLPGQYWISSPSLTTAPEDAGKMTSSLAAAAEDVGNVLGLTKTCLGQHAGAARWVVMVTLWQADV